MLGKVGEHECAGILTRLYGEDEKVIRQSEVASAKALHARRLVRGGCGYLGNSVRVLDYALALDGGTQILVLELANGERMTIGLDGRMGSPTAGKQLFIGSSPESPAARMLSLGGSEERNVISLLERWIDETQGFLRRDALMEAEQSTLQGQDLLDRMAMEFLMEVRNRDAC
jgi:hypothetical protein